MKTFNHPLRSAYGKLAADGRRNCEGALQWRSDEDVEQCVNEARKEGLLAIVSEFGELLKANWAIAASKGEILIDPKKQCYQVL